MSEEKSIGYFWFSLKQGKSSLLQHRNFCNINGKILEYTEWKTGPTKSNWDDAVFLGIGTYHGNSYTLGYKK